MELAREEELEGAEGLSAAVRDEASREREAGKRRGWSEQPAG
jgi:hypothetical protein